MRAISFLVAILAVTATANAQVTGIFEGGSTGLGVAATVGNITVSTGFGGGYLALEGLAENGFLVFGALNGIRTLGALGQAGGGFEFGPSDWIARPSLRLGGAFDFDGGFATGGFGLHIGRRAGGVFTVDVGSYEGVSVAVVHLGAYYSWR